MATPLTVNVAGIGPARPRLADWPQAAAALREPDTWLRVPTVVPAPLRLPATERRRAGLLVKASVGVADAACQQAGLDPALLATVFGSATGDATNCDALCQALALPERLVSPTRFTNSVHNAPAGYWHIAAASGRASTSLAAFDATAAAALLEACVQCVAQAEPVLLVVCDQAMPEPLAALRPVPEAFAFALVLTPKGPGPRLQVTLQGDARATTLAHAGFEALRQEVPAARSLPLLQALALNDSAQFTLALHSGSSLQVSLDKFP